MRGKVREELVWAFLTTPQGRTYFGDEDKAKLYAHTTDAKWRLGILHICDKDDRRTIELGLKDQDEWCRELAHERFYTRTFYAHHFASVLVNGQGTPKEKALHLSMVRTTASYEAAYFHETLKSADKAALRGLAKNESLSKPTLEKVMARLEELDDMGRYDAETTLEKIERAYPPQDPHEWFGNEKLKGKFLEDKIDFIALKLLERPTRLGWLRRVLGV